MERKREGSLGGGCQGLAPALLLFVSVWGIMSCNYQRWLPDERFCLSAFSQEEIPYFVPTGCQQRGAGGCYPNTEEGEKGNEGENYLICLLRGWREGRHGKPLAWGQ